MIRDGYRGANELRDKRTNDTSWQFAAACFKMDPNIFVSEEATDGKPVERYETIVRARRICAGCPVRVECLEYAYESPDSVAFGVFAGTTGTQRTRMRDREDRLEYLHEWFDAWIAQQAKGEQDGLPGVA